MSTSHDGRTADHGTHDVICIGAGPTGLACAIEAKRAGMRTLVIDKGCLCNSLYHYPANMLFFTTPERMEIGDLPMTTVGGKPTRAEALKYYRRAVEHYGDRNAPLRNRRADRRGRAHVRRPHARCRRRGKGISRRRKVIIATGYYDLPNYLGIPGEELPHVSHYFTDAHPYWNQDVVVIGGKNSAAEAALDLFRGGARVTLVHRDAEMGKSLKYWVKPDIENRIRAGEIQAMFSSRRHAHRAGAGLGEESRCHESGRPRRAGLCDDRLPSRFRFPRAAGNSPRSRDAPPRAAITETLETNVPGIYVAGVVVGGMQTSRHFHRKWPFPWAPDRRRHPEARQGTASSRATGARRAPGRLVGAEIAERSLDALR